LKLDLGQGKKEYLKAQAMRMVSEHVSASTWQLRQPNRCTALVKESWQRSASRSDIQKLPDAQMSRGSTRRSWLSTEGIVAWMPRPTIYRNFYTG